MSNFKTSRSNDYCWVIIHNNIFLFHCKGHFSIQEYSWCSTYGSHLTILLIFFLFVWIKYLTFYISKVLFLRYLKVLWFYKFDFLEQYLRELFNTGSGFLFETKSSTSGPLAFICLHYWMEVSRLFFYLLKPSIY